MTKKEIDQTSGVETTGHVWDHDLKELNNPLPRWWLLVFYATIIWAIGYWVLYPAWPGINGYTKGMLGYSSRAAVTQEVQAGKDARSEFRKALAETPLDQVTTKPELLRFAKASGKAAFGENCAPCHGQGAQGFIGYPNLNDDDWIWGGSVDDIYHTIQVGIRSTHEETRQVMMPRFGVDQLLESKQISDVAEYVLSLSGQSEKAEAAERGKAIFAEQCVSCHGEKGEGNPAMGAPNLADAIWLYGAKKEQVVKSISTGRGGMMPAWQGRLDDPTIRALSVYVASLGGAK